MLMTHKTQAIQTIVELVLRAQTLFICRILKLYNARDLFTLQLRQNKNNNNRSPKQEFHAVHNIEHVLWFENLEFSALSWTNWIYCHSKWQWTNYYVKSKFVILCLMPILLFVLCFALLCTLFTVRYQFTQQHSLWFGLWIPSKTRRTNFASIDSIEWPLILTIYFDICFFLFCSVA